MDRPSSSEMKEYITAEERGDPRPAALLATDGRGVTLRTFGENARRTGRTHTEGKTETDARRRGIQGGGSVTSIPRSFGATAGPDEDSSTMSDDDNRTPSQRGGSGEKTRNLMPEFNQLSEGTRRRHGDGRGCERSRCRARDTDLLYEMHALRCGISSLCRRFAEMEVATRVPLQMKRTNSHAQRRRTASAKDRGTEGPFPPPYIAEAGSAPAPRVTPDRVCFSCRQPGHMRRQCPYRNQITEPKAYIPPGGASSAK